MISDDESIVLLSSSEDDDDVKEIKEDDDFDYEEEEKVSSLKELNLRDVRGGIILQEESFVRTKSVPKEASLTVTQDMTTQTEPGFPLNQSDSSDPENKARGSSSRDRNDVFTVSDREASVTSNPNKDAIVKSSTDNPRSRNNSVTSNCNNGLNQNKSNSITGSFPRYNAQRQWKPRPFRPQPYNRPNQCNQPNSVPGNCNNRFFNDYNFYGIPSNNYNNFARQNSTVRERYIQQFRDHLCRTFAEFLNNILPFNFSQESNNNYLQNSDNNISQGPNNNPQGNQNFYQQKYNFPRGNNF